MTARLFEDLSLELVVSFALGLLLIFSIFTLLIFKLGCKYNANFCKLILFY